MKKRYNVMLSPALMWRVDGYAEKNNMSRSKLINDLLSDFIRTKYGCTFTDDLIPDDNQLYFGGGTNEA